jgi:hypothetical protein
MFVKPRLTAGLLFKGIIGFQGVRSAAYVEEPQNSLLDQSDPVFFIRLLDSFTSRLSPDSTIPAVCAHR